ncbi:MAG: hypothetical protein JFR39_00060 [Muribaculaceae bacterium]|nr:hypothetical protein [Muribaculaceae bacterium]
MKKVFSLMLLLATMLTFTACSSDDEPENSVTKDQLIGLWDATAVQFNNDGKWVDITNRPDLALSISFYEDGSYYGEGALGDGEGTYTLSGNTIKTYIDGELYGTYVVKSLVGDNAELTLTMDHETIGIRARKSKISLTANDPSIIAYNGDPNGNAEWEHNRFEGGKLYQKKIQITDWTYMPWSGVYTIIDDQVDKLDMFCLIIEVEGKKYRVLLDSQTSFVIYRYSFDGKTLIVRDYDTKGETVYSASVNDGKLTISDGTLTEIYTKVN